MVISVKNLSGFVSVDADGSWSSVGDHKHKSEHHPNPVSLMYTTSLPCIHWLLHAINMHLLQVNI